ncbi:MAG: magnesium transporter CorA family protein [Elusimicrobiota bacterium]
MIEILYNDGKETREMPIEELKKIHPVASGILWVDLYAPTPEETRKVLLDLFKFHPLTVEDCQVFVDHPKIDDYDTYLFGVFHSLVYHEEDSRVATWEVDFFVGKNFIVTNHLKPVPFIPELKKKFRNNYPHFLKGTDFIVQHILDTMIDSYYPVLSSLRKKLNETEKEVFSLTEHDTINDIYRIKRNLSLMKRVLLPQIEVLSDILCFKHGYFSENSIAYFNDVINHAEKIRNKIKEYNEMGRDTLDAQLSISSYKMNDVIKRLTAIMTVFMPLTVITGIGGMSEWSMITGTTNTNWIFSYLLFTLGLVLIGIGAYYILKKMKWI